MLLLIPLHLPLILLYAIMSKQHSVHGAATVKPTDIDEDKPAVINEETPWRLVQPPSVYEHQVWHVPQQQQQQQHPVQQQKQLPKSTHQQKAAAPTQDKSEKLDIYLNYASPKRLSYGHVEANPQRIEQRFGMRDEGNRYKGMVIWADRQGGYGEQQWDLVQGAI